MLLDLSVSGSVILSFRIPCLTLFGTTYPFRWQHVATRPLWWAWGYGATQKCRASSYDGTFESRIGMLIVSSVSMKAEDEFAETTEVLAFPSAG